jgi:hypothetical protein
MGQQTPSAALPDDDAALMAATGVATATPSKRFTAATAPRSTAPLSAALVQRFNARIYAGKRVALSGALKTLDAKDASARHGGR